MDAIGVAAPSGSPDTFGAPQSQLPVVWALVLGAAVLWYIWPWLEHLRVAPTLAPAAAAVSCGGTGAVAAPDVAPEPGEELAPPPPFEAPAPLAAKAGAGTIDDEVPGLDTAAEFASIFAEAAALVGEAMQALPKTPKYALATAALRYITEILDNIFQCCGTEKLARVLRLKEDSKGFAGHFGEQGGCRPARALLELAGFRRDEATGIWSLCFEDGHSRLRAFVVRLCLQKHLDLQRRRGNKVWMQANNDDVVPRPSSTAPMELFGLACAAECSAAEDFKVQLSLKEKNAEVAVRYLVLERRAQAGCPVPLCLHKGLASAARALAQNYRLRARENRGGGRASGPTDVEVHAMLAKLPLPGAYRAVHLHCTTDELPHVFGLTSTRGGGGRGADSGDVDKAAEAVANEVVGTWAAWQAESLMWPCAVVCGVGASLDYTINSGFVTALFLGFEGVPPEEDFAATAIRERRELKERQNPAVLPKDTAPAFGARVATLGDPTPKPNRRRG